MERSALPITAAALLLVVTFAGQQRDTIDERARRLHFASLVLDTHIDVTPKLQQKDWNFFET